MLRKITAPLAALIVLVTATAVAAGAAAPGTQSRCRVTQLRVRAGVLREALGQYGQTYVVTNTSNRPCTVGGYAQVTLVGRGMRVPARSHRSGAYVFVDHGAKLIHLAPGGTASFAVGGAMSPCPTATIVKMVLPNGGGRLTLTRQKLAACADGLAVTAIRAGRDSTAPGCASHTSAYGTLTVCRSSGAVGTVVKIRSNTLCGDASPRNLHLVFLGPTSYVGSGGGGDPVPFMARGRGFSATYRIPESYSGGGTTQNRRLKVRPGRGYAFATYPARGCGVPFVVAERSCGRWISGSVSDAVWAGQRH